jgi:NAD+ kinase
MILADPRNPAAQDLRDELVARLPDWSPPDVGVVIGGDGFMLHTIAAHGRHRAWLGLNAGRIGFLMNDADDVDRVAGLLRRGAWFEHAFPMLQARVITADGTAREVHAVNDVVLERASGQTAHLRLSIDGTEVVDTLVADGIVFASALGSTAYSFSAGGPACHPTLQVLAVTAISPHHPRLAPVLLPPTSHARVEVQMSERRPVRAVADGAQLDHVVAVEVGQSDRRVRLAWLEGSDFTARMITKILRP